MIAGPIVRYNQIVQELAIREEKIDEAAEGMRRFVYGLAKKVLIANYLAQIADNTFDYMSQMSVMTAWLGSICYTLQIYYDFSGYSDMAIGIGRMFGFHFSENFRKPRFKTTLDTQSVHCLATDGNLARSELDFPVLGIDLFLHASL